MLNHCHYPNEKENDIDCLRKELKADFTSESLDVDSDLIACISKLYTSYRVCYMGDHCLKIVTDCSDCVNGFLMFERQKSLLYLKVVQVSFSQL